MSFTFAETKQLLQDRFKELKEIASEQEQLFVAPVCNIRCFVPCRVGECICREDIPGFVVVNKAGFKKAQSFFSEHLEQLRKMMYDEN